MMGFYSNRTKQVLRLGRRVPRVKKVVRQLNEFLHAPLPPAPATWDFASKVSAWPMDLNDQLGDCVIASSAHLITCWTANESGAGRVFSTAEILAMYARDGGYVPGDPSTDNGCVMTEHLDNWLAAGFAGDALAGYLSIGPQSAGQFNSAVYEFGGAKLGINMPAAWQGAFEKGQPWDVGPNTRGEWSPGSWGGHDVPIVGRRAGGYVVVTWGGLQLITPAALAVYCDESYVLADWDWCQDGTTPSQISKADLIAYWKSLGGGDITPPTPPVPPPPPPPAPPVAGVITIDPNRRTFNFPLDWSPSAN